MANSNTLEAHWKMFPNCIKLKILMQLQRNPRCLLGSSRIKSILDEVNPRLMASLWGVENQNKGCNYWFHPEDIEALSLRFKIENQTYTYNDPAFA